MSLFLSKPKYKVLHKYVDINSEEEAFKLSTYPMEIPDLFSKIGCFTSPKKTQLSMCMLPV